MNNEKPTLSIAQSQFFEPPVIFEMFWKNDLRMTLKNGFHKCLLFVLSANGWKEQNMDSSFSAKFRSIDQSCCSMTSKRFLESFLGMKFIQPNVRLTNQNPGGLDPFHKPIKSFYFCSFVVFVLFVRFHFKVTWKSL